MVFGSDYALCITKVVAAWSRANPSSTRSARVVSDLDKPALRSTRNALGVLAGGGEADLADDHVSGEVKTSLKLPCHLYDSMCEMVNFVLMPTNVDRDSMKLSYNMIVCMAWCVWSLYQLLWTVML